MSCYNFILSLVVCDIFFLFSLLFCHFVRFCAFKRWTNLFPVVGQLGQVQGMLGLRNPRNISVLTGLGVRQPGRCDY